MVRYAQLIAIHYVVHWDTWIAFDHAQLRGNNSHLMIYMWLPMMLQLQAMVFRDIF